MVIGLLTIAAIPTTIGVAEAISAQKKANNAAKEKAKFAMTAELSIDDEDPVECPVVLREDGRLYLDHPDAPAPGYAFSGFYFMYPGEEQHLGLVSMASDDPPALHWMFVDKDTGEMKHGKRADTLGHVIGPWYWSNDERWLTLRGDMTGFVAVEEEVEEVEEGENKKWALYLDRDRDGGGVMGRHKGRWAVVGLRRRMALGMDSSWVRDSDKNKGKK